MWLKIALLIWLFLGVAAPSTAQQRKVRFSVSAASIAELPFRMAQVKGFYREDGLDVEMIFIRGAVGMQALIGGAIEFTQKSLGDAAKEAMTSQVFDFSFVNKAVR